MVRTIRGGIGAARGQRLAIGRKGDGPNRIVVRAVKRGYKRAGRDVPKLDVPRVEIFGANPICKELSVRREPYRGNLRPCRWKRPDDLSCRNTPEFYDAVVAERVVVV